MKRDGKLVVNRNGEYWINRGGEGIELMFKQEDNGFILKYIASVGVWSGHVQEPLKNMFKKYGGKIEAVRTWEGGDSIDTLKIGYGK